MEVRSLRAGLLVAVCGVLLTPPAPAQTSVVYKGLFAPGTLFPAYTFSMDDTEKLKQDGFNIANVSPLFAVNDLGNVTQCTCDAEIAAKILEYHTNNIAVAMIPILFWTDNISNCPITNSLDLLSVIATTLVHDLEYLVHITNLARLAEEYCVDVFSPYNEPDKSIGAAVGIPAVSQWGQDVYPLITNHFSGKVYWKSGIKTNVPLIDFSSYDIIGTLVTPGSSSAASFTSSVSSAIVDLTNAAATYGVPEVVMSEFGPFKNSSWTNFVPQANGESFSNAHQIVYYLGAGILDGFFVFDGLETGTELAGTPGEVVVSNWYNNIFTTAPGLDQNNNVVIFVGGEGDGAGSDISTLSITQAPQIVGTMIIQQ
jgi:hypothetical protein